MSIKPLYFRVMFNKPNKTQIKRIKTSSNAYLVQNNDHLFMIDSGDGDIAEIEKACRELDQKISDLELIIITHAHWDHVANVKKIKALTGAIIIAHQKAEPQLLKGSTSFPDGTSIFSNLLIFFIKLFSTNDGSFSPVKPDILIKDVFNLQNLGINGRLHSIPGHTLDSIAVIIDRKHCFVGDTMFNLFPGTVYPLFANDEHQLKQSWKNLTNYPDILTIYPGHGKPFSWNKFNKSYKKI